MLTEDSALRPVRAFMAERVVGAWLESLGGAPVHVGGNRPYDIEDGARRMDAKLLVATNRSERCRYGCDVKVFRGNHKPFDPDATTDVALVGLPYVSDMAFQVTEDDGKVTVSASCGRASIFLVASEEFNAQLEPGCGARIVPLATDWLEQHKVQ